MKNADTRSKFNSILNHVSALYIFQNLLIVMHLQTKVHFSQIHSKDKMSMSENKEENVTVISKVKGFGY